MQQCMVERFTSIFGSFHKHLKILHHLLLPAEISETERSQGILKVFLG